MTPGIQSRDHQQLNRWRGWTDDGTRRFDAEVRHLRDHELREPSMLAGWSRAHVVAHVARNADALGNLLTWARTGVETPMYESAEQRDRDIEEGAAQSVEVLRFDLDDAERRLAVAVASMPEDAWWAEVRTRAGRAVPAAEAVWMRCREVWIHSVDLDAGASFADLPADLVDELLGELAGAFTARPEVDGVELVASDTGGLWTIGPHQSDDVVVQGQASALLGWLLGRDDGATLTASPGALPVLPRWL